MSENRKHASYTKKNMCTYSLDPIYLTSAHHTENLSCHQIDELSPLGTKGGIIVCAKMGDVHLIRDLAHLLDKTAEGLALHSIRNRVNDGT